MSDHSIEATAYSYIRFSTPEQSKGDSLRRQTESAAEWCAKHNARLDTSRTYHDLGKSAYLGDHRKNPDRFALAAFLKLVEDDKIPRGSYLIIEALDRLTREHVRAALMLCLGLIEKGIRIVQLSPTELVYDEKSDEMALMLMIVELSRGHRESKRKSDMLGKAWQEKKRKARQNKEVLTKRLPAWVREADGKLEEIPDRAAVVRRIFDLAANGYGAVLIIKKLEAEGVPAFGRSKRWGRAYINLILSDERAMGVYQPRRVNGSKDGDPVPGYYPKTVTQKAFDAARAGAASRSQYPGRIGKRTELFSGLLHNARDGGTYFVGTRTKNGRHSRVLINTESAEGRSPCWSFPYETFERAVLTCLKEIPPHEILNGNQGPDETQALAGELARVETSIGVLNADMDQHGESTALMKRVREKESRKAELTKLLAAARRKAAHSLSESWGETQTLLEVLDKAPDPQECRLRLRAALRRIIDEIWLAISPLQGKDRICIVEIWFAGGERWRTYSIIHKAAKGNAKSHKPAQWYVKSTAGKAGTEETTMRKSCHTGILQELLDSASEETLKEIFGE